MTKFLEYMNEDLNTDYLETAACIGVIISKSVINDINKFLESGKGDDKIKKAILSILNKPYDWISKGKSEVIKRIDKNKSFIEIIALIKGMYNFVNDVVEFNKKYFIHDKIDDYYKLEKEYLGAIRNAKANTADCIISNVSVDKIFDAIRTSNILQNNKTFVEFENGVKFYQVSLKKGKDLAQLGKVTTKLKTMGFDLSLNESKFIDFFKRITSKTLSKIKNITKSLIGSFNKHIKSLFSKKITKLDIDELSNLYNINEKKIKNEDLINTIVNNPDKLLNRINNKIDSLKNTDFVIKYNRINKITKINNPDTAFKLSSNYKTVKLLEELKNTENLNKSIKEIISDMLFGGTKLPLWKVYGDFDSGSSYEYLGTIDLYMDKSLDINIDVLGVKITKSKDIDYYTITIYMLNEIDEKGKKYIQFRTGTNSSSHFSFVVEGTKSITIPINKNLKDIL